MRQGAFFGKATKDRRPGVRRRETGGRPAPTEPCPAELANINAFNSVDSGRDYKEPMKQVMI